MATTARTVCRTALRNILSESAEAVEPTAAELKDVLEALNDMLASLSVNGINISHQTLALDDNLNLDEAHMQGIKAMLSVKIAPQFGAAVDPLIAFDAQMGKTALQSDTNLAVSTPLDTALLRRRYF